MKYNYQVKRLHADDLDFQLVWILADRSAKKDLQKLSNTTTRYIRYIRDFSAVSEVVLICVSNIFGGLLSVLCGHKEIFFDVTKD